MWGTYPIFSVFAETFVIIYLMPIIYLPGNQILCQHWMGSRSLILETVEVINIIIISDLRRYQSRPIRALINIQCLNRNNQKNVKYADLIVFLSIFEIYFPCDNNKDSPDGRLSAVQAGAGPCCLNLNLKCICSSLTKQESRKCKSLC